MLMTGLEERGSWGVRGGSQRGRESQPPETEAGRWEMRKDKGGHVGRCHQLEGKWMEFNQTTGIYVQDS